MIDLKTGTTVLQGVLLTQSDVGTAREIDVEALVLGGQAQARLLYAAGQMRPEQLETGAMP